jgi:uncharacterized RDD family membrane protein YckC
VLLSLVSFPAAWLGVLLLTVALKVSGMGIEVTDNETNLYAVWLAGFLISTAYFMTLEWLYGATWGKVMLGKRVIRDDGRPCTFVAALVRALLRLIDGILFGLVAYQQMKNPLRQHLGDRQGHTLVVSAGDPFIQRRRPWYGLMVATVLFLGLDIVVHAGLVAAAWRVAPNDQLYGQPPAADLNLTAADLGGPFELHSEAPLKVSSQDFRDGNDRFFTSADSVVVAHVFVYKVYLNGPDSQLAQMGQAWTKAKISTARNFQSVTKPGCIDRASLQWFSNEGDDEQGYILVIEKRNVHVYVLSFGNSAAVSAFNTSLWGCTIAERIR